MNIPTSTALFHRIALVGLRVFAALFICFAFTGCPAIEAVLNAAFGKPGYEQPVISSISHTRLARGQTVEFVVRFATVPESSIGGNKSVALLREQGPVPTNVAVVTGPVFFTPDVATFQVSVDPNAPLEPIYVFAELAVESIAGITEHPAIAYEIRPIEIVRTINGLVPHITSVTPAVARRGESVPVDIIGENFDNNPTVIINTPSNAWPGVTVDSITVLSTTQIRLALTVDRFTRTGDIPLFVRTDEGRSTTARLQIAERQGVPVVTGIYPGQSFLNETTPVVVTGENFEAGQMLEVFDSLNIGNLPPSDVTIQPVPRDRLNNVFTIKPRTTGLQLYTLEGTRGAAVGHVSFRGVPPNGITKPLRILSVTGSVTPGTVGQLLLETNGQAGIAPEGRHPPTEAGGLVMSNIMAFTPQLLAINANRRKVIVQFDAAATSLLGPHYIALANVGATTTSNLVPFNFIAPRANAPLVRKTTIGQIQRMQSFTETIEGERLNDVRDIRFLSRGIRTSNFSTNPAGTVLTATFTALDDADLTDERLTTFQVITRFGGASNHAGYIVLE